VAENGPRLGNALRTPGLSSSSPSVTKGESIIVDRLLRSTEALRVRKEAVFVEMEEALFAAMCELWPQPERRAKLRLVAMVSMGIMRLAIESWRQDGGGHPVAEYLEETFAILASFNASIRRQAILNPR
jgi:hypothetical protein